MYIVTYQHRVTRTIELRLCELGLMIFTNSRAFAGEEFGRKWTSRDARRKRKRYKRPSITRSECNLEKSILSLQSYCWTIYGQSNER